MKTAIIITAIICVTIIAVGWILAMVTLKSDEMNYIHKQTMQKMADEKEIEIEKLRRGKYDD